MEDLSVYPAPDIHQLPVVTDVWTRNRNYFRESLPTLLAQYRDKYVAVHDNRVVAVGDTLVETALAAYAACGYVPVYADLVTDKPQPPGRIPYFREVVAEARK